MSAYIVEDETTNRILAWLRADGCSVNGPTWGMVKRELADAGYNILDGDIEALGQAMFNLNAEAVDYRYEPGTADKDAPEGYTYTEIAPPSIFQALKSLRCWLYQCSEGTVPDQPLYKTFESVKHIMMDAIISSLPEYDRAEWA